MKIYEQNPIDLANALYGAGRPVAYTKEPRGAMS